eukprot:6478904-Amphidinium_carterae.1
MHAKVDAKVAEMVESQATTYQEVAGPCRTNGLHAASLSTSAQSHAVEQATMLDETDFVLAQ